MITSRSCSWCHTSNLATTRYCENCHHEAHVARLDCSCPRCATTRKSVSASLAPMPIASIVDEAIAGLRGLVRSDCKPTTTPNKPNSETITSPKTREFTRTPVSDELATKIRAFDQGLMAEFGPVCFAYSIIANDGLVAASNSRDGFVEPLVATATDPAGD